MSLSTDRIGCVTFAFMLVRISLLFPAMNGYNLYQPAISVAR
ncbi:hypothetical protein AB3X91_09555 [Paraburkholderia sp. BR14263]